MLIGRRKIPRENFISSSAIKGQIEHVKDLIRLIILSTNLPTYNRYE